VAVSSSSTNHAPAARRALSVSAFLLAVVPIPFLGLVTIVLLAGGGIAWPNEPAPPPSPLFIPFLGLLVFDVIALVAFVVRPRRSGWWLLVTSQGADIIATVFILASTGWWVPFGLVPCCSLASIALLLVLRGGSEVRAG
jgi:hypothetical protein